MIEGVLRHCTEIIVNKQYVDSHGQSEVAFAFCHLLGFELLPRYLHSLELRREIHEGLNVVENWNSANNFILYGKGGEFATNRREDQEITMLSLHLLQLCPGLYQHLNDPTGIAQTTVVGH